eukprot:CAMPEP_0194508240 /NCGR_PEP_ID=MMETSP0253-20130528/38236_1 /TAXON_ID=2966 /ORGANISM="Noctiluca scintillans" /LENGTH=109 /DNA_ID=CAMNT_0039351241 /DNA_START=1 /DNA_END=330 /DNA_ORIENTATION=-
MYHGVSRPRASQHFGHRGSYPFLQRTTSTLPWKTQSSQGDPPEMASVYRSQGHHTVPARPAHEVGSLIARTLPSKLFRMMSAIISDDKCAMDSRDVEEALWTHGAWSQV